MPRCIECRQPLPRAPCSTCGQETGEQPSSGEREAWSQAYHRQASADWDLYWIIEANKNIPWSQALHVLQMATEKLAKAYRVQDKTTNLNKILTSHVGFEIFLEHFLKSPGMTVRSKERLLGTTNQRAVAAKTRELKLLAREVERLAPAVDRADHPANAEYPWWDGRTVVSPLDHHFQNLDFLFRRSGQDFPAVVREAIKSF